MQWSVQYIKSQLYFILWCDCDFESWVVSSQFECEHSRNNEIKRKKPRIAN